MKTSKFQRILSALLALCLTIGLMVPVIATEELSVSDYDTFMKELKVLEDYAESYAASYSSEDAHELVLNFIRTGVERYNDGNWVTLAGPEKTAFVTYVAQLDAANGTTAMRLRNILISDFKLPNGDQVDFGHMFGTMNIAYLTAVASADLGGWAGDLCDLLRYSKFDTTVPAGTIEEMTAYILENCFLVDAPQAFGMDDFCGDLDAFYLDAEVKKGGKLSELMDAYFTADLNNADRSAYFMNNRFKGLETREDVREAVFNAYASNIGVSVLEADRGLSGETDLRKACCYAFADYLFDLAGDRLEGDTGSDDEGGNEGGEEESGNKYYSVFSSTESNLAPGVSQSVNYAYTTDDKQIAFYVATVDVNRDDVSIFANYKDHTPGEGWGLSRVRDQMLAAQAFHSNPADPDNYIENYTVVAGVNGDFYNMSTGKPSGPLVMHGVSYNPNNNRCFFAMLKDGSAVIGSGSEWSKYADNVQESVGGSAVIVRNGEIAVSLSDTYYKSRASRTAVGITAEGEVVLMVLDGRQEPFSAGGSLEEIAQIMIDAGCVIAMNLDGGGSSTFVSKAEGSDEIEVVNRPSDGFARSVSSSLVVVSTALVSKEFDHANIITDYDYVTPYTPLELKTVGVSISGHAATIPENAVWNVSDENVGYIEDGVFYGIAELDEENREQIAEVQLVADGKVVGSKTIHVVLPTEMEFEDDRITAIFGQPTNIAIKALYNGTPVAYNEGDIFLFAESGGECVGFDFIGDETSGLRVATVYAGLFPFLDVIISTKVQMYREDEAMFDFDNLTGGDREFGWIRDITNSYTYDDVTYLIQEAGKGMELSYIFGLDMESIGIPAQLADLTYMLPGADAADACAWNFLLQLAERVSTLTTVVVKAQFDMDLDVDISGLTFANDYFYMKEAKLDEATNSLTITCGWYDQTAAIDPATANPICILSGIKATPKDGNWNGDKMTITNVGDVKYDIYLRANALYSFAQDPANQKTFGLYPFDNKDVLIGDSTEKGAYFSSTYATFQDSFILDRTDREGWYATENNLYYYVDNKVITGTHKLPGYEDPNNLYYYTFGEDGACTGTVTGLFELEDGLHYAVAGEPKTGWHTVTVKGVTNYYYFYPSTGVAADGVQTIDGFTYTFTDCVLTRGDLVVNEKGTLYRWAGEWMSEGWLELDGKIAFVQRGGYFATGLKKYYYTDGKIYYFAFGEDGFLMSDFSGFYDYNGGTYLIEKGYVVVYPGLIEVDGDYYYFNSKDTMVKDCTYWVSKNNGYVKNGNYVFGPDGKMVRDNVTPSQPTTPPSTAPTEPGVVLNGIVKESEEDWYYYVDGVKTYAGVIEIDGAYYYVNSKCKVIHNQVYWVSKNNGYVKNGNYTFDAEGKMVLDQTPTTPTTPSTAPTEPKPVLNGIVKESEETWYYYVDGVKTYAGVIEIDGAYYYVNSKGLVIHNQVYWVSKNNGYVKNGNYTFDAEGKMVLETEEPTTPPTTAPTEPKPVLNGIVKESEETWYYYVDGVKTYAGVIEIDGAYYYVNSKGLVIHNQVYWVSKNNGYVTNGNYTFDAEGKMVLETEEPTEPETSAPTTAPTEPEPVLNGIVKESEDVWYYYVDGVKTYAGVIEIDGAYYYVNSKCLVIHNQVYWVSKNNGYVKNGNYTFDAEGKMVL